MCIRDRYKHITRDVIYQCSNALFTENRYKDDPWEVPDIDLSDAAHAKHMASLKVALDLQGREGHFLDCNDGVNRSWARECNKGLCLEELGELFASKRQCAGYTPISDTPISDTALDVLVKWEDACAAPTSAFTWPRLGQRYKKCMTMALNFLPPGQCIAIPNRKPPPAWLKRLVLSLIHI